MTEVFFLGGGCYCGSLVDLKIGFVTKLYSGFKFLLWRMFWRRLLIICDIICQYCAWCFLVCVCVCVCVCVRVCVCVWRVWYVIWVRSFVLIFISIINSNEVISVYIKSHDIIMCSDLHQTNTIMINNNYYLLTSVYHSYPINPPSPLPPLLSRR